MSDYVFLKACRREPVPYTPVWIMRQAGRYMPEYQAIRGKTSFLGLCKTPELAVEVTLLPIDMLGVDAAILFSDILVPVEAMGMPLDFVEGRGPVLGNPVRSQTELNSLSVPEPEEKMPFVMEIIRMLRTELEGRVPLIGFSGAPFTLASYMVEGGTSKSFVYLKKMMYQAPELYHSLMTMITDTVIKYMNAQADAGAQALQIFDTWAGILSEYDYRKYAFPYTKRVIDSIRREGIPIIHFINSCAPLIEVMKETAPDVIGVDWRISMKEARKKIGSDFAVQGNLEPSCLFLPEKEMEERIAMVLEEAGPEPGHIFNLGHGIMPQNTVKSAAFLVDTVHRLSAKKE